MNTSALSFALIGMMGVWGAASAQEYVPDLKQLLGPGRVSIYGNAAMEYAEVHQGAKFGGGELPTVDLMESTAGQGNKIGLRGHTRVKGNALLWWQCENSVDLTGTSQNGFCGRNAGVGVARKELGTLFVGSWETPIYDLTSRLPLMENTGFWGTSFLLFDGSGTDDDGTKPTSFLRRQEHTFNYWTPQWAGFAMRVMVSAPTKTATGLAANSPLSKPRLYSVGASYTLHKLYLTAVYEEHHNFDALATGFGSNDYGYVLGAQYRFPHSIPFEISGLYTKQNFRGGPTDDLHANVSAWDVSLLWKIHGPHKLKLAYTNAGNTGGNYVGHASVAGLLGNRVYNGGAGGTAAHAIFVWYQYDYAKSTTLSLGAVQLNNDRYARYSIGGLTNPAGGTRQYAVVAAVKYKFNFALVK